MCDACSGQAREEERPAAAKTNVQDGNKEMMEAAIASRRSRAVYVCTRFP